MREIVAVNGTPGAGHAARVKLIRANPMTRFIPDAISCEYTGPYRGGKEATDRHGVATATGGTTWPTVRKAVELATNWPTTAPMGHVAGAAPPLRVIRPVIGLTVTLIGAAWTLSHRSPMALFWLLAGGGAGLYLFGMDVLYDLENGIWWNSGAGGVIELVINVVTLAVSIWLLRWAWTRRHALLAGDNGAADYSD